MSNLKKLSPEKLQKIQNQEITELLQQPGELGTNKFLINVNGQNSKIITNKNGIIKYTLEQPLKLNIGDRVTLLDSFVEERGLSVDTISFEEPVEEEMRFLYYQQGDCQNSMGIAGKAPFSGLGADQKFAPFPNPIVDCWGRKLPFDSGYFPKLDPTAPGAFTFPAMLACAGIQLPFVGPSLNYVDTGDIVPENSASDPITLNNRGHGATGQYYYMMEWFNPAVPGQPSGLNADPFFTTNDTADFYMRPVYGATTIKIPAGNYSVSALSDLINNQLTGYLTQNPNNPNGIESNALNNKLFNNTNSYGAQQTYPFFDGITGNTERTVLPPNEFNPDSKIIGADTYQAYQRRRGDIMTKVFFNPFINGNNLNLEKLNLPYGDGGDLLDTVDNWATGEPLRIPPNAGERYSRPQDLATCYDKVLFNSSSPDEIKFKRFQSNFFLNLNGFRHIYENTENAYYNVEDPTKTIQENISKYQTKNMPTLQHLLCARLGAKGPFLYNLDATQANFNSEAYGDPNTFDRPARYNTGDLEELGRFSCLFPVASSKNDDFENEEMKHDPNAGVGAYQQFAGTSTFNIVYDTESSNRFSLQNLHEPYKLASAVPDNTTETKLGGQQGTKFNTPVLTLSSPVEGSNPAKYKFDECRQLCNYAGAYPIDTKSGVAVNNFAFSQVKDTTVYKTLVKEIEELNTGNVHAQLYREKKIYDLFTKPFDEFFNSVDKAKDAWAKTFWNRIGFSYEQMGDVTNNLESIFTFSNLPPPLDKPLTEPTQFIENQKKFLPSPNPKFIKQMGVVTHNKFNYTYIPSSCDLGLGNVDFGATPTNQGYDLRGYTSFRVEDAGDDSNEYGVIQNNIHILTDSQPINASDFPSLNNGNNYLIIESDIVKRNAIDAKSNRTTIVGIMSKENSSNDTIFSVNPITFIVTEPKILATIEVRIKNPDGTLVSDDIVGKNNGFIFQIEQAIQPEEMTMEGI